MAVPATTGVSRTTIASMQIGDYIIARYWSGASAGQYGGVDSIGTSTAAEMPLTGLGANAAGSFYFVKAERGLLIADRIVHNAISWDTLNTAKVIQGSPWDAGNIIPVMTSPTAPSGIASSSLEVAGGEAWKAFDTDLNFGWDTGPVVYPSSLSYEFPTAKVIRRYSIKARNDVNYNMTPKDWTFEGWDGTKWVILDKRAGETFTQAQEKFYMVQNSTTYIKYRVNITANNGATAAIHIASMRMMDTAGIIRSLTGGVAYADASGNMVKAQPTNYYGGWPTNSEWDKYVVNSTLTGKITAGDNNVWHWSSLYSWCQDTPLEGVDNSTSIQNHRVERGNTTTYAANLGHNLSSSAQTTIGFRPVFEYREV